MPWSGDFHPEHARLVAFVFLSCIRSEVSAMRDFAIHVTHRPGEIARVASALARKDVNIKAITGLNLGNEGVIRVVPDNIDAARTALRDANIRFDEHELATVLLENKAGELAEVASKLANANINVQAVYMVGLEGDLVELAFAVDDASKAKKLLG
jgi:hypothetical protein